MCIHRPVLHSFRVRPRCSWWYFYTGKTMAVQVMWPGQGLLGDWRGGGTVQAGNTHCECSVCKPVSASHRAQRTRAGRGKNLTTSEVLKLFQWPHERRVHMPGPYIHFCMHTHARTHARTHAHTHTHTHTHTTHTHTRTHTDTISGVPTISVLHLPPVCRPHHWTFPGTGCSGWARSPGSCLSALCDM